jgi:hypothetical protein
MNCFDDGGGAADKPSDGEEVSAGSGGEELAAFMDDEGDGGGGNGGKGRLSPQEESAKGGEDLGFGDQQKLTGHFIKHNPEFNPPFSNEQEYENAAIDFMTQLQAENPYLHEGIRNSDMSILRVDESKGWFGIIRDGKIRTFFIPDPAKNGGYAPADYFLKQIDELIF